MGWRKIPTRPPRASFMSQAGAISPMNESFTQCRHCISKLCDHARVDERALHTIKLSLASLESPQSARSIE